MPGTFFSRSFCEEDIDMPRTFFGFFMVFIAVGGLQAQENSQLQADSQQQTTRKGKLFEGPPFGNKLTRNAPGSVFDALRDKRVQEEIGLLPLQLEDLLRLSEQVMKEIGPTIDDFNKLPKREQEARASTVRKDLADYLKGIQAEIDKILLPEQQQRLQQIAFQFRLHKSGAAQTFLSPDLLRELGIDDQQAARLSEGLARIEEEYFKSLEDLEIEKERKTLALFTPAQQNRLKSIIGPMMRSFSKTSSPKALKP
jgi:hypothetical protein